MILGAMALARNGGTTNAEPVTSVKCSVEMVRFADGSVWQRPRSPLDPTMLVLPP